MSGKRYQHRVPSFASLVAILLLLITPAKCQITPESQSKKKAESRPAADSARWQYMLDDLAREARTIPQEEKRPLLIADVADAYWELDQGRAREFFMSALEAALSLKAGTSGASQALRRVIGLAAKRDTVLAHKLSEKVIELATEKDWAASESMSVATDLLESDTARAAKLAQAQAPAGPSVDAAWFILQLSRHDPAAADQVYSAYLSRFAPDTGFGLDRLLWLAGYPFGYAEAFGGSLNPTQMVGFNGLRISGPTPRPVLAQAFLDVAFRASQHALRQANSAPPQQAEALNGLVLFTAAYLLPEVRRYRPQSLQAWLLLEQQAVAGTTLVQQDGVAKRVQQIIESRPKPGRQESAASYVSEPSEDLLGSAEKMPSGCKRDTELIKAALNIGQAKDFSRAFVVLERIEDESLRDSVRQFLYYDISIAAITRGDSFSLDEAQKYAERVASPQQRALLYIKIAKAMLRHQNRPLAAELLGKTRRLAETVSEPEVKTSILLGAASGYSEFDAYEGYQALKEAVKTINSARSQNVEDFHILRKVNLACREGDDIWYGDADQAERFSLFETFAAMASADVDGMLSLARALDDPSIRIRSLISIAKAMTKKARRNSLAFSPR
jgi:hypothetical protein